MFDREIKFIYDFNLNKLNKLGAFFSFEQLRETDIHPAILQYISAELDFLIFEDRQKLVKDSIFDYSGEKVAKYFTLINEELKKTKRLSADYVAKIVLHSISFNINFLVRPKWALTRFIFEEESHRTTAEIKQILNYLYFYKYLRKILTEYISGKKVISMNSAEFVELLNKIDGLTLQTSYHEIITVSLKSMADFFNIGGVQRNKVPFNAVQMFLEEKGLEHQLSRLRREFSDEPSSRIELTDLQYLLTSVPAEVIEETAELPGDNYKTVKEPQIPVPPVQKTAEPVEEPEIEVEVPVYEEPPVIEPVDEIAEKEEEVIEFHEPEAEEIPIVEKSAAEDEFEDKEIAEELKGLQWPEDEEVPAVENKIYDVEENLTAAIEMEGLIEETEKDEMPEKELVVESDSDDYDDWVFVEEKEHDDIIKEITETSETEIKKTKHSRKKASTSDEELSLFEAGENSFGAILKEEENALIEKNTIENYEEAHNDFSKLLENKDMGKLIDTLFDCDIEEMELMLNSISFFNTYEEAERFIDVYFVKMGISAESEDVSVFKEIIKRNFKTGR